MPLDTAPTTVGDLVLRLDLARVLSVNRSLGLTVYC
jgi:hypothetical protein